MSVAAVLDRLRSGAERVGAGRFKVDSARALAKLRDFRLADPHHYCLELLRAAVASDAPSVDVWNDADELEVVFGGKPFPAESLRDLFAHALAGSKDPDAARLRLMALGVIGALALKPRVVEIQGSGLLVRVTPPGRLEVSERKDAADRTRVYVRKRGWRVLKAVIVGPREAEVIRERTAHFPAALTLNGGPVRTEAHAGVGFLARRERRSGSQRLLVGVPEETRVGSWRLKLTVHGVLVCERVLDRGVLPLWVWAADDTLRRNASGSDVVDDDPAYRGLLATLDQVADDLLEDLVRALDGPDARKIRPFLVRCAAAAGIAAAEGDRGSARARKLLRDAPLLPGPSGEWVTVDELRAAAQKGPIRIALRSYPKGLYERPVVLFSLSLTEEQRQLIPEGRRLDIDAEVQARIRRDRNKAKWEAQPEEEPRLPNEEFLARATVEGEDVRGEVALPRDAAGSVVRFLLHRRLLEQREVAELRPLRLRAVVDSGRLRPDDLWQGATPDHVYDGVVNALREAAVEMVAKAVVAGPLSEELRRHARDAVAALLSRKRQFPEPLRSAPVYELAGGGWTSPDALERSISLRYVTGSWPYAAFDGEPVVVLPDEHGELWTRILGRKKVRDVDDLLRREGDIRRRLAGPKEEPRVEGDVHARAPVEAPGIRGEIAVREGGGPGVEVRLLRDGFRLEVDRLEAPYGRLVASVDCPALSHVATWDAAVRNEAHEAVVSAVRGAEPKLLEPLLSRFHGVALDQMPLRAREYVLFFLKRRFGGGIPASPDAAERAALETPLFGTNHGPLALREVLDVARRARKLWVLPPEERAALPETMTVVTADEATAEALGQLAGLDPQRPWAEIERLKARAEFDHLRERSLTLPDEVVFHVPVAGDGLEGVIGHLPEGSAGIRVAVLYTRRLLCTERFESDLSLEAVVDVGDPSLEPTELSLPKHHRKALKKIMGSAERRLVEAALEKPEEPGAGELLLRALAVGYDRTLPALGQHPLLPTTTGRWLSAGAFERAARVCYVTRETTGELPSGEPVVVAVEPAVRAALSRFGKRRRNVTTELGVLTAARAARERTAVAREIRVGGSVLRRRRIHTDDVEGEVALVAGDEATLAVFHQRRLLCREALAAPAGVAAAVNCDRLAPKVRLDGVRHDGVFRRVVDLVLDEVAALGAEAAAAWPETSKGERARLQPVLVRLAAWLLVRGRDDHPLLAVPLLRATDERPLSFADLVRAQGSSGCVRFAERAGALMDPDAWVLRPRVAELALLPETRLRFVDATEALRRAEQVRATPPADSLAAPVAGRWREPVAGGGMEGEVALRPAPGVLTIELLRERRPVETLTLDHAIGGVARVNHDALRPDASWSRVERDAPFQAVRSAVEAALERALTRLLREGKRDHWQPFLRAALRWQWARAGPVAEALAQLPAFRGPAGAPVTLGQVLAAAGERGRVAILERGLSLAPAPAGLVLVVGEDERAILAELKVKVEDLSDAARAASAQARRLEDKRVRHWRYPKRALVRLAVEGDGWRGELALPDPPDEAAVVVLARDGVAVDQYHEGDLGIAGVLDHPELPVSHDWERVLWDDALRGRIRALADALLARLAEEGPRLAPASREVAAWYALRALVRAGVTAPQHLDRLSGTTDALARSPIFDSVRGSRVDLRAVAAAVLCRAPLAVVVAAPGARFPQGDLALRASHADATWLDALEAVLGAGTLQRFADPGDWRTHEAERDPEPSDPVSAGLARLRREADLLRTDAFGRLSPELLRDIRLHGDLGGALVRYDAFRHVALLDRDHPGIQRALSGTDGAEERHVLLLAIYGAVNRALDSVTDADESRLAAALLAHLAEGRSLG